MTVTWKLDIAYDGTNFHGWQSQPDQTAIQDHIEKALKIILKQDVRCVGSSRTDSGVHAWNQVASIRTDAAIDPNKFRKSLNALLPDAVKVKSVESSSAEFHPIFSSQGKLYLYRLWTSPVESPFLQNFSWRIKSQIDVESMIKASQHFVGEHDFSAFSASDSTAKSKIRDVWAVQIEQIGPLINIWVYGKGFLKQMVRTIVGTLVDVGHGKLASDDIPKIIDSRDRNLASQTAPAQGLTLAKIFYEKPPELKSFLKTIEKGYNISVEGY
jgi:tRNA pseudouridine38-40 synthase